MKQRDVFMESEGDAWFERNSGSGAPRSIDESDPLIAEVLGLAGILTLQGASILEIGCGDGARLAWLKQHYGCDCSGVDPSARAVEAAGARAVVAQRGTAEHLPFADRSFDIVMFGFCLYLCDREDLFGIAAEADRVLKNPGWLLIHDFHSPSPSQRAYHHRAGIYSHKMDYRTLFTWHPGYTSYSHKVRHHAAGGYTDEPGEWVATSVLRKNLGRSE